MTYISGSLLTGRKDTQPAWRSLAWPDTFTTHQILAEPDWANDESIKEAKDGAAWCPAYWPPGYGRTKEGNAQISHLTAVVLDIDKGAFPIHRAIDVWYGYDFVLHTTYQHTPEAPRYRIVLPFDTPKLVADHYRVWSWAMQRMRNAGCASLDTTAGEKARLFYLPSAPPSRASQVFSYHGQGQRIEAPADFVEQVPPPVPRKATRSYVEGILQDARIAPIEAGCAFLRHAKDDATTLPYPEWRAALSLWLRCIGGRALIHEYSSPHPTYSKEETDEVIEGLSQVGPYTCDTIRRTSEACTGCTHTGTTALQLGSPSQVTSPGGAGVPELSSTDATNLLNEIRAAIQAATAEVEAAKFAKKKRSFSESEAIRLAQGLTTAETKLRELKADEKRAEKALAKAAAIDAVGVPEGADPAAWAALKLDARNGTPLCNKANILAVLSLDPVYAGCFVWNEFSGLACYYGKTPTDKVDTDVATDLENRYGFYSVSSKLVNEVIHSVAQENRVHPVRDYLNSIAWDGEDRLSTFFAHYMGADASPEILSRYAKMFFVGAVARVFKPGCKMDTMLILCGPQYAGKTEFLRELVTTGDDPLSSNWFSDTQLKALDDKDTAIKMAGVWLIEIGEMGGGFRNADRRDKKQWLSMREDRYRPPHARHSVCVPRQFIVAGTTNEPTFLSDPTGSRRYLVVKVGDALRKDLIPGVRDQLWSQAVALYRSGYRYWFENDEIAIVNAHNDAFYEHDAWTPLVARYLKQRRTQTPFPRRLLVSAMDVWQAAMEQEAAKMGPREEGRIKDALVALGCKYDRAGGGSRQWGYLVPEKIEYELADDTLRVTGQQPPHPPGQVLSFPHRAP